MKKLAIVLMALTLAACNPKAEQKYGYKKVMPPELSDCKVFYIYDGTKSLYVTRCGFDTNTSWDETCGKKCVRTESVALINTNKEAK